MSIAEMGDFHTLGGSENASIMTMKEAALKSLEDLNRVVNHHEVYKHIVAKGYYDFKNQQHPTHTVSALLGDFIRKGDARVKRISQAGGTYAYYLAKNEQNLSIETLLGSNKSEKPKGFDERDLHIFLSTFLKNTNIYSKTIFHEQSLNGKDGHQTWIHPDMVGIQLMKFQSKAQTLLKAINRADVIRLSSFEIKKEITSDYDLKKFFFQAVSNSSWANFGYLVAFNISEILFDEMERLNQSFGIGIIQLRANPFESKVLFHPKFRELDFKTIDKLCKINIDFEKFIEQAEKLLTAGENLVGAVEGELEKMCDESLPTESEAYAYCKKKGIPISSLNIESLSEVEIKEIMKGS